jgi:hypothetical protein
MKANSNLAVIRLFGEMGAGADIVSVGEMKRALAAGIPAKRIIYSGVGKKPSELMAALEAGVGQINVESSAELETLNAVAGLLGLKAVITIRVNPDVDARTHAKITTGRKENKFGIDIDLARDAAHWWDVVAGDLIPAPADGDADAMQNPTINAVRRAAGERGKPTGSVMARLQEAVSGRGKGTGVAGTSQAPDA